jgi:hypothetical protein
MGDPGSSRPRGPYSPIRDSTSGWVLALAGIIILIAGVWWGTDHHRNTPQAPAQPTGETISITSEPGPALKVTRTASTGGRVEIGKGNGAAAS